MAISYPVTFGPIIQKIPRSDAIAIGSVWLPGYLLARSPEANLCTFGYLVNVFSLALLVRGGPLARLAGNADAERLHGARLCGCTG